MTRIDIVSGFLGAGKTTFIQRLLDEALKTEKVVLIENEFGEIGIDGGFLKDAGIEIREMNQGCICCSLVGNFEKSLQEVVETYQPDRIIIEPSGVGKLSDIIGAVKAVSGNLDVELDAAVTIVDAQKAKLYSKNFGEFFNNQILYAGTVVLSRTDIAAEEKVDTAVKIVKEINPKAQVVTTPEAQLTGEQLIRIISGKDDLEESMMKEVMERVHAHEGEEEDDDDHDVIETLDNGITIHHHHDHHHHHHH
ncbi:MAG: GTP-binding protein, partial [Lachnospiraceae bacterium]|nr:GTP-binding protein [Lachnospiraceae bacterium]